jgi:hypothetical protein
METYVRKVNTLMQQDAQYILCLLKICHTLKDVSSRVHCLTLATPSSMTTNEEQDKVGKEKQFLPS